MIVVRADAGHAAAWACLREELWPDGLEAHRDALARLMTLPPERGAAFVAVEGDEVVGFVEATIRHDYVNGCDTSPVAFLEGLFITPAWRRRGVAAMLIAAVEGWARHHGLDEIASDADLGNVPSHALHAALGFAETERVVYFRKPL